MKGRYKATKYFKCGEVVLGFLRGTQTVVYLCLISPGCVGQVTQLLLPSQRSSQTLLDHQVRQGVCWLRQQNDLYRHRLQQARGLRVRMRRGKSLLCLLQVSAAILHFKVLYSILHSAGSFHF